MGETATKQPTTAYDVHPMIEYGRAIAANLPKTTGRSLEEWLVLVGAEGPAGIAARRDWLKAHGVGGTTANLIAEAAEPNGMEILEPSAYLGAAAGYVEAMYAGPKAHLRPIFEAVLAFARGLGSDVRVCPCQTIVPLYRENVFAELKPSTRARVDLGLCFKGVEGFEAAPPVIAMPDRIAKKDRIAYRIPLESVEAFDDEARGWLARAYRAAAPKG